jgi:hypothetical protein
VLKNHNITTSLTVHRPHYFSIRCSAFRWTDIVPLQSETVDPCNVLLYNTFGFGLANVKIIICIGRSLIMYWLLLYYLLHKPWRTSFLIVLNGVCWSIWKQRNNVIFNESRIISMRTWVCLILSLIAYWAGGFKRVMKSALNIWLP